jgi:soluble cytochrome b562
MMTNKQKLDAVMRCMDSYREYLKKEAKKDPDPDEWNRGYRGGMDAILDALDEAIETGEVAP